MAGNGQGDWVSDTAFARNNPGLFLEYCYAWMGDGLVVPSMSWQAREVIYRTPYKGIVK